MCSKTLYGFVGNPWLNSEYKKKKHVGERGSLPSSTYLKNLCSKRYELFTYYLLLITYYFKTRINGLIQQALIISQTLQAHNYSIM
ncbi:MAG: hypothetical protein F6K41_41475 [Symploca sp. SIO3E6]|nr:hypothetical protein [Caldora sp. SIO3E6]